MRGEPSPAAEALRDFDSGRLRSLLARFEALKVGVIGDFFLDKYLEVDPSLAEPSLETGKVAHQVVSVRHSPGAAGTVAANLAALGAGKLFALGFTGDDGEGYELRADLAGLGVDSSGLHVAPERRTPTYLKPRDLGRPGLEGEHSRYDTKNRGPTGGRVEGLVLGSLDALLPGLDALVVMDQVEDEGCGVLTRAVTDAVVQRVKRFKGVAWADSRRRIRAFRGLTLKMNQFELAGIEDPAPGQLLPDGEIVRMLPEVEALSGSKVFATSGERGVWVGGRPPLRVPGVRLSCPTDPTGAGDSFTAGAVLALAAGAAPAEAALVGNLVASITVRQLGTTGTAKPAELLEALSLWKEQNP
jgi:bifunctional ADP-heptose synthase (sugar kinase/adenylyltransferase)